MDGGLASVAQIAEDAKAFNPDFVGVTCWSINRETVWNLCAALHGVAPGAFLVLGGPHASIFPEHVFKKTHASAVVIGEGEKTFKELLHALESGGDLKGVKGLAIRDSDGLCCYTGNRDRIDDLDSIPLPYYEGFKNFRFNKYAGFPTLPRPTAPIISSRGCVFNCSYCSSVRFWGNCWKYRSAENILQEIEWLIDKMGARSIYFFDDNFPVRKERVISICEGIKTKRWNISWACCSHVRMINKELLTIMKDSGCKTIDFGVESGSDKILKNINKKQTCRDIEKTFAIAHEVGINPRAYLMVGNMGETEATIDETIEMVGKINPRSSIGATILWLLPGTAVYDEAVKKGHITDSYWLDYEGIPYNLQEYSFDDLYKLRERLMRGIAKKKGGILPLIGCCLKCTYYKYPFFRVLRSLIPDVFK